jgi:hypothetical protein
VSTKRPRNYNFLVVLPILTGMLLVMITLCRRNVLLILVAFSAILATIVHARTNPYDAIVERNAFGLRPPPPPVTETNQAPAETPVKVVLTGITSIFGPEQPRAFLEIVEQAPPKGGTPVPPRRPILGAGDREGDVEVLSIDIGRNVVKIRNGAVESELTFEERKPSGPTPTGHVAGSPAPVASPAAGQPIIVSSSESRGGITMAGGGGGFQGNTAGVSSYGGTTQTTPGNFGGLSSYGGVNPAPLGALGSGSALPTIPSRTIRTPTVAQNTQKPVDIDQQELILEANRMHFQQNPNKPGPPIPPTRLTQDLYPGGLPGITVPHGTGPFPGLPGK